MADPGRVGELAAGDGTPLRYRSWEPASPRGAVVVVHGLGEHSGRYAGLARRLDSEGVSMYAPDLRGHGLSGGRRGHAASFETYLTDLEQTLAVARTAAAGRPVILFGHSMGGLVALRYAQSRPEPRLAGLILSAPQIVLADPPPAWLRAVASIVGAVVPILPLSNRLDAEDLSHDPREIRAYRDDPLVHDRITPRLFREMERAMAAAVRDVRNVRVPAVLLLIPGADPIVDPRATREMAVALRAVTSVEVREYPGLFHEPLHETERDRVIADIAHWVRERMA